MNDSNNNLSDSIFVVLFINLSYNIAVDAFIGINISLNKETEVLRFVIFVLIDDIIPSWFSFIKTTSL